MYLNNKRKNYVKVDKESGSEEIFALLNKVNSNLEDDIGNLMNIGSLIEFVSEESLEN